jgi:hypothetical protein
MISADYICRPHKITPPVGIGADDFFMMQVDDYETFSESSIFAAIQVFVMNSLTHLKLCRWIAQVP